jgi:hypothetical protein
MGPLEMNFSHVSFTPSAVAWEVLRAAPVLQVVEVRASEHTGNAVLVAG